MLGESAESRTVTIHTEADIWEEERSLEDEDFIAPRRSRQENRSDRQDPLETSETNIMLRSILHRTIAIERSVNEMRAEIVTLRDRVARIEGKL